MTRTRLSLSELLESEEDLLVLIGAENDNDNDGGADENDQDEDQDDDASGDEDEDSTDEGNDENEDNEDDVPGLKAKIVALESEKDRHFRKFTREKKRADALEAKLAAGSAGAQKKSAKKDEDEDDSESTRKVEVNETLAVENAFLTAKTKHEFVNVAAALKLLDRGEIDIDEDGSVDGMEDAINQLAKDHSYLLKKKEATNSRRTGDKPTSKTKNTQRTEAARQQELLNRYPALRNR